MVVQFRTHNLRVQTIVLSQLSYPLGKLDEVPKVIYNKEDIVIFSDAAYKAKEGNSIHLWICYDV